MCPILRNVVAYICLARAAAHASYLIRSEGSRPVEQQGLLEVDDAEGPRPVEQQLLEVDYAGNVRAAAGLNGSTGQWDAAAMWFRRRRTSPRRRRWWGRRSRRKPGDCWNKCGKKPGNCSACGVDKACCRLGNKKDPWECGLRGCTGYHCCVTAKRNCKWQDWGKWGDCSITCGGGNRERARKKTDEIGGGSPCFGESMQIGKCNEKACPLSCKLQPWEAWSPCTVTCGGGSQERKRSKAPGHDGANCEGPLQEKRDCNSKLCSVDCEFGPWGAWGQCSKTCGTEGVQSRKRQKTHAENRGNECVGPLDDSRKCQDNDPCPVDCVFMPWNAWTKCSRSCDGGYKKRERTTMPAKHGGRPCYGSLEVTEPCNEQECPAPEPPPPNVSVGAPAGNATPANATTGSTTKKEAPKKKASKSGAAPLARCWRGWPALWAVVGLLVWGVL